MRRYFNLAVAVFCITASINSGTSGRWGWAIVQAFVAGANAILVLDPPRKS